MILKFITDEYEIENSVIQASALFFSFSLVLCLYSSIVCTSDFSELRCKKPTVENANITPDDDDIGTGESYTIKCVEGFTDANVGHGIATCNHGKLSTITFCAGNCPNFFTVLYCPVCGT